MECARPRCEDWRAVMGNEATRVVLSGYNAEYPVIVTSRVSPAIAVAGAEVQEPIGAEYHCPQAAELSLKQDLLRLHLPVVRRSKNETTQLLPAQAGDEEIAVPTG